MVSSYLLLFICCLFLILSYFADIEAGPSNQIIVCHTASACEPLQHYFSSGRKKIKHYLCQTYHTLHRKNAEYTHTRLAYRYDVWCCTKCFDNWTIGRGNIPCRVGFGLCGLGSGKPTFGYAQLQYWDQVQNTCIM